MDHQKQHFRHILLFYYRKAKNPVQARRKLCDVYGEDVLTKRQCQNWFAKLRSGNFNLEDAPRSGRRLEADVDKIKSLVEANRRITIDIWVPHILTERNLLRCINDCDTLIRRQRNDPFLKRIVTGDEKSLVYNNVKRKRSWSEKDVPAQTTLKPDIHQKGYVVRLVGIQGDRLFEAFAGQHND